jgi:sec-independent protein translocase protein TatA
MGSFGTPELVVILIIILVLFGGRKIPEIMRGLGQGMREFRSASKEATDEITKLAEEEPLEESGNEDETEAEVETEA